MDAYQKGRAEIALRRLESEKNIKRYKLNEHFQNVRLCLLLRIPYSIIKQHNNTRISVSPVNGMVGMSFPDDYIPIRRFLQRSDAPTFADWLAAHYPEEFEKYERDKMRFLFGTNTELKHTDSTQRLYDEFDKFTWYRTETERKYYFSALLSGHDLTAFSEFDLFGSTGHSVQEIEDFRQECISMQREYEQNPDRFFHPADDLGADADAVTSGSDSILAGSAPPGYDGEGASELTEIMHENE
jgi:hypothetical protein